MFVTCFHYDVAQVQRDADATVSKVQRGMDCCGSHKEKPQFCDIKAFWTVNRWKSGSHSEKLWVLSFERIPVDLDSRVDFVKPLEDMGKYKTVVIDPPWSYGHNKAPSAVLNDSMQRVVISKGGQ